MDVVFSVAGKIGEFLVEKFRRQFGYFVDYNSNIKTLQEQVQKLEAVREDIKASINAAKRKSEVIKNEVHNWTSMVDGILSETKELLKEASKVKSHNLASRYQLSKKAEKKGIAIKDLQNEGKFDRVSNSASPPTLLFPSQEDIVIFESTKLVLEEIMMGLRDNITNFIGIHGMGGVGKTTLVKEVVKRAQECRLFTAIAMAVVSQTIDVKNIQDQIAEILGLDLKRESSEQVRASRLYARLKNENKVLIILDDIWARLDLAVVGIPFGHDHTGCKIIVTTRRRQVCDTMIDPRSETVKIVPVAILSEKESWVLLKKNAGDDIESPTLNSFAKDILKECGGLPIALVTVGRAMRGKDLDEWQEAAGKLRKSRPEIIEGMDKDVYKCLQFSYDYLRYEEAKKVFKLCCLFPEDYNIPIENMVRYGFGLKIFEDVESVEDARRSAHSIIKDLKNSCLLLASDEEGCVKMHDVVRDVALSISSDYFVRDSSKKLESWPSMENMKHYTGISIMQHHVCQFPDALDCPNLKILFMHDIESLHMPKEVLSRMKAVQVFHSNCIKLEFSQLINLRTLILEIQNIDNTTAIGELKMLEILRLYKCTFSEPFTAIGKLTNLRVLDISQCFRSHSRSGFLSSIFPTNAISQLSKLEEMYMLSYDLLSVDFFNITELKSLPRLTTLEITVPTIPEGFVFPNLKVFSIYLASLTAESTSYWLRGYRKKPNCNYLHLYGTDTTIFSLDSLKPLLSRTNDLYINSFKNLENLIPCLSLDEHSLAVLKTLRISGCQNLNYLINVEEWKMMHKCFLELEELYLIELYTFKALCNCELPTEVSSSLSKLKRLRFCGCPKMLNVFSPLNPQQQFKQLELLVVDSCPALQYVFERNKTPLSLNGLVLLSLKGMKHIWKSPGELLHMNNLQHVSIESCNKLKVIFPASIAQGLEQLIQLELYSCDELEAIVGERQEDEKGIDKVVFSQLTMISLDELCNLKAFCMDNLSFKWPSLVAVEVRSCPKMITFANCDGNQSTPKLKVIQLNDSKIMLDGTDLNTVIKDHNKVEGVAGPSN